MLSILGATCLGIQPLDLFGNGGCTATKSDPSLCTFDDGYEYNAVFCDGTSVFHTFKDGTEMRLGKPGGASNECEASTYTLRDPETGFEASFEPFMTVGDTELRYGQRILNDCESTKMPYACTLDVTKITSDSDLKEDLKQSTLYNVIANYPRTTHVNAGFDTEKFTSQSGLQIFSYFNGFKTDVQKFDGNGEIIGSFEIRQIIPYEDIYNAFAAGVWSVGASPFCAKKLPEGGCDYSPIKEGTIKYAIEGFGKSGQTCSKTSVQLNSPYTSVEFVADASKVSTNAFGDCVNVPATTKLIQFVTSNGIATIGLAQTFGQEPQLPEGRYAEIIVGSEDPQDLVWSAAGTLNTRVCFTDTKNAVISQCLEGYSGNIVMALDPELSIAKVPPSPPSMPPPQSPTPSPPPPPPTPEPPPPPSAPPPSSSSTVWFWIVVSIAIVILGVVLFWLISQRVSVEVNQA